MSAIFRFAAKLAAWHRSDVTHCPVCTVRSAPFAASIGTATEGAPAAGAIDAEEIIAVRRAVNKALVPSAVDCAVDTADWTDAAAAPSELTALLTAALTVPTLVAAALAIEVVDVSVLARPPTVVAATAAIDAVSAVTIEESVLIWVVKVASVVELRELSSRCSVEMASLARTATAVDTDVETAATSTVIADICHHKQERA
jgi:hypothetical protein